MRDDDDGAGLLFLIVSAILCGMLLAAVLSYFVAVR